MPLVCKQRNPIRPHLHLTREYDGADECEVSVISPFSKVKFVIGKAQVSDVEAFLRGTYGVDAFPYWTMSQQESAISGMTEAEQNKFYGPDAA